MKKILIATICLCSLGLFAQKETKNHKFHDEFLALRYLLDSIVPFNEKLKDRILVSNGRIDPAPCSKFYKIIPDYKGVASIYYKWRIKRDKNPNKIDTIQGGGTFCPKKHGLKKMRFNSYRKRAEKGIPISRITISSMIYDEETQERLILIGAELKYHPLNRIWHVVVFAVLDGKIVYIKEGKSE